MLEQIRDMEQTFQELPGFRRADSEQRCRMARSGLHTKIVVLDDDPTGIQTVHGVYVYTDWTEETISRAFCDEKSMFFILTNSRGLTVEETTQLHRQIAETLARVSRRLKQPFCLISRSDSTLRGHYPLETEVLRQTLEHELGISYDGEVIIPFFPEGGRFTLGQIHYVAEKNKLVPAGQTEFAADKTFGFANSQLPAWIEEKTGGRYPSSEVCCISLAELRCGDSEAIAEKLCRVSNFGKIVVDAMEYGDVEEFVIALLMAMERGRRFLFRTAAAFPKVLGGISSRSLLTKQDICTPGNRQGGLVIAGSHVKKTTVQLAYLMKVQQVRPIEFNQHLVTESEKLEAEIQRVVRLAERTIAAGQSAAVFTRRNRLDMGGNREEELRLAVKISDAVTTIVQRLQIRPAWIIAKGGITSSEIGVKGLGVQRAMVMGQVLPGVPVWKTGTESKFPGLPYVIFPGNVGSETAIRDLVALLME